MADRRMGRDPASPGPQPMAGVSRRPEFLVGDGMGGQEAVAADSALDASRAVGRSRGDLRGRPTQESPEPSLVQQSRRRRPAVAQDRGDGRVDTHQVEHTGRDTEMLDETEHDPRASRRSARDPREYTDREFSEDRELTDAERLSMLRQGYFKVVLPDLPKKTGFHRVWLTTTNPRDTIAGRLRMGYRLLRFEDLGPGWEQQKALSGEYSGCIVINEMIASELPERLHQLFSHELHHRMPRESERGIFGRLEEYQEDLARKGSRLIEEETGIGDDQSAFEYLRSTNPRPKMFE